MRGIKSYPIPSTRLGGPSTLSYLGIARMLPIGSAPTIRVLGHFSLNFLEIPLIVPPVPTPRTIASIFPSHWYKSSSAS